MIKANELRIGNKMQPDSLHLNQFHRIGEVTQIHKEGFTVDYHYPGKWFEPIPLTPEILESCGFEKITDGYERKISDNVRLFSVGHYQGGVCVFSHFKKEIFGKTIGDLHQLQNLYFALTGEELKINLNVEVTK